jgi:hypothetical protein
MFSSFYRMNASFERCSLNRLVKNELLIKINSIISYLRVYIHMYTTTVNKFVEWPQSVVAVHYSG